MGINTWLYKGFYIVAEWMLWYRAKDQIPPQTTIVSNYRDTKEECKQRVDKCIDGNSIFEHPHLLSE